MTAPFSIQFGHMQEAGATVQFFSTRPLTRAEALVFVRGLTALIDLMGEPDFASDAAERGNAPE